MTTWHTILHTFVFGLWRSKLRVQSETNYNKKELHVDETSFRCMGMFIVLGY